MEYIMNPIEVKQRIEILDYLRGFALLGIILVNIPPLVAVKAPLSHSMDGAYERFLYLFVEGRFYTIFSFLFGVGFYLFLKRAIERGGNGVLLFLRRMLVLFLFGIIHVQFHPGEALSVYAVCGIMILPFYLVPKQVNLVIGILVLALCAALSIKIFMTVPLMLLGICAGQYRVFEEISARRRQVAVFTGLMLMGSVLGLGFQIVHMPSSIGTGETQKFMDIGITIGPFVSAFYAGGLILILQLPFIKKLLLPIKNYGRMALTNYILQTVFILMFSYLFNMFANSTYIQTLYVCIIVYVIQLIFSTIWLHYYRFGPLEWIWRIATYGTTPPMRK
jgi:uncharacterized membrane protein YeiB